MKDGTIKTVCRICHSRCRIILTITEGRITSVEGDGDPICPKGKALGEIVHAPDRLLYPMKRDGDNWSKISWDSALEYISTKLVTIAERYGPQALAVHTGLPIITNDIRGWVKRFCNLYGTPNHTSTASQCNLARVIGNSLTCGTSPIPDYEKTNCIFLWGYNPANSNPNVMKSIVTATERGAKLIVVDPRATTLTRRADIHLQNRPESNRILALAMLYYIISEGLYDKSFVDNWTTGFDKLKESLDMFDFSNIQTLSGLTEDQIEKAAHLYATSRPSCIIIGNALEHHIDAVQGIRAISILQAISGNLDIPGGALINPSVKLTDVSLKEKYTGVSPIGIQYSLLYDYRKEGQANLMADAILENNPYPVRAMIIDGANPVLTYPNTRKVEKALGRLDLLVVMDLFVTESAKYADIALPAATFLERDEVFDQRTRHPMSYLKLIPAVLPSPGECWTDLKFWFELAKRMGYGEYFPWKDIRDAMDYRMEPLGITVQQLENEPEGIPYTVTGYRRYEQNGFTTDSGKVEIYSKKLERLGHQPLPSFVEKTSEPDDNTVILSSGARAIEYVHSQFRNIPSLRDRNPEPFAEISPETAEKLDLCDGEKVIISSKAGKIEIRIKLNQDILPGTVFIPHGWGEVNANVLTDDHNLDPISGFPVLRSLPCEIKPE